MKKVISVTVEVEMEITVDNDPNDEWVAHDKAAEKCSDVLMSLFSKDVDNLVTNDIIVGDIDVTCTEEM